MKLCQSLFIFLFGASIFAQDLNQDFLDSKSYDYLVLLFDMNSRDTLAAKQIAQTYINKARTDNDSTKMARGYEQLASVSRTHTALKYLDTTINLSINSKHRDYPGVGYLFKSFFHFYNDEYEKSLQNAILGYQAAKQKDNFEQQIAALNGISSINRLWGDYQESLETEFLAFKLLSENPGNDPGSTNYLTTIQGIGSSYLRLKKPDSALTYFRKGIKEALKVGDSTRYYDFVSRSGGAYYLKENFSQSMDSLQKGDLYREEFNNSYLTYFYYHLGSIFYGQGDRENGIEYFKKIDSIYDKKQILTPELPRVYDKLVNYYSDIEDNENQLKYLYKQVLIVRLIDAKRINIKNKTNEDYAIPKMLEEKEALISELEEQNNISATRIWWAVGLLVLSVFGLLYYFNRQKVYKTRFENLMTKQEKSKTNKVSTESSKNEISSEIIEDILKHLEAFEAEKKYLSQEVSLHDVAKSFGTNSTYLSKVINLRKDKNFSHYINDLRIEYTVQELKDNPKYRKYTIKAIANECGFKSAESFSKTFYKKYGIYPSYYLKQLEK